MDVSVPNDPESARSRNTELSFCLPSFVFFVLFVVKFGRRIEPQRAQRGGVALCSLNSKLEED
jgi:hypothetical protein